MKIVYEDGKKTLHFGYCKVIQERNNYNAIYRHDKLLTHQETWKRATKIASLLKAAYDEGDANGYNDCLDEWSEHNYG